jgi:predicted Rossmann fold nucleotide-binding protein DprA/Smf involved in DNA uptake
LGLLGPAPVGLDALIAASGAGAGDVLAALTEAEIEGQVLRQPGGHYVRTGGA